ncbi:probable G-protein coupled receptor 171 isoform X1 [Thunnus maccoyii]|uniref:probable G-protein coupled receptor 171 isoform X1 n=1 Tax=Thunnus maccoyii TaxID=8240 RepID=UPI001C4AA7D0|nr:probable G-protein coupled receptor 171 isoform X1 [Thunnus maccoyii]XP_042269445.1 probable G-protein coupled receptor 171 isoform X1 [Thunnus maccoyii]XP_042269446.1 probable G-protein coupled receptor 171 isoform X1 [Thunnus maccoyii]XP_042269447.1 probable G-protein coupled receptor 171 isoform X1 [Thunnus maccoyii]XP_042269448.1 probable G-protein coupled receptor 171 isoform X1 [Thunnus maccoyii]XP_042269449.1 probable G-protein coupled receptor 171 isoform X1 [Thunnus maccoyii]XP_04
MTPPPPPPLANSSAAGAEEGKQCIVNDQMAPFTVLYILIFIISLPGNLLSVWAFIRSPRAKQQSSSVYLVNLLVADLLLLLALPFKILKDLGAAPWSLMVFHCQASAVTIYISLYASIAFLAFIITDRYLQDSNTLRSLRLQEVGFARLLSLVVWVLLLLLMVPNMALPIQQVQVRQYLSCSSLKKDISLHWHALTVFLCTALFLNASAAVLISSGLALKRLLRSRGDPKLWVNARRATGSVTAMALAFLLCFVPYHVVRTPYTLAQTKVITDCQTKRQLFLGKESTLLLTVLHLCFDPLLFFYLYSPFRQTVSEALCCITTPAAGDPEEQQAAEEMMQTTTAALQEEGG